MKAQIQKCLFDAAYHIQYMTPPSSSFCASTWLVDERTRTILRDRCDFSAKLVTKKKRYVIDNLCGFFATGRHVNLQDKEFYEFTWNSQIIGKILADTETHKTLIGPLFNARET